MAEPAPCRWGAMSILMRLKNKVKEKLFWYRFLNEPDSPNAQETDPTEWMDTQQCDNEASISNHHDSQHSNEASTPNHLGSQQPYFDAPQDLQNPSLPQFATLGQSEDLFSQMLHGDAMMPEESTTSQDDLFTEGDFGAANQQPWKAHQMDQSGIAYSTSQPIFAEYGCNEEYVDAPTEMQDVQSSIQRGYSAPQLGQHISAVEKVEMMDTGDSSNLGPVAQQSSAAVWQRLIFFRQYLEIDREVEAGPGWRVVLGIVSRIIGLIRRRRQRRTPQRRPAPITTRRIKSGEGTRFKGIRPRNGKWVSEIRIGGTPEKVWLGSYNTEKEAALAFDAGKHHCSLKKTRGYNFVDSPRLLGAPKNLSHLTSSERRTTIQRLAEDYARAYGSADIR